MSWKGIFKNTVKTFKEFVNIDTFFPSCFETILIQNKFLKKFKIFFSTSQMFVFLLAPKRSMRKVVKKTSDEDPHWL